MPTVSLGKVYINVNKGIGPGEGARGAKAEDGRLKGEGGGGWGREIGLQPIVCSL
jgi:hypothetical protein